MYQLNYRSNAKLGLQLKDLDQILETAVAVNSARNITGCLIYHKGSFVQVLEGQKKDVLDIYENIKADDRHNDVTLLWENEVDDRFFPEWNMAYFRPKEKNLRQYIDNLILLSEISDRSSGSLVSFWSSVQKILKDEQAH
ncbi:FAD-dependent sensor of blue light [Gelidibacter sediminis]|uniref:FAD-dependent sensor of blue light n=1 Tax=Gelidibacter sediminis TaxID=1608710 RepID=A0A4R7PHF5_9FLAO|nr:BLUF domain-containing protein [Gelidibacter sediminis]TDU33728.1 FAD-dependent sensor of blue light [Gelidibacter sediminis]